MVINLSQIVQEQSKNNPDKIAVKTLNLHLTYFELESLCNRAAHYLATKGVKSKDIVALSLADELSILIGYLAVLKLGAAACPIPQTYPRLQKARLTKTLNPNVYLIAPTPRVIQDTVGGPRQSVIPFSAELVKQESLIDSFSLNANIEASQPAFIFFGSGTTGRPKLLPFTHDVFRMRAKRIAESMGFIDKDCLAASIHLNFASPLTRAFAIFLSGGCFAIPTNREAEGFATLKDWNVTFVLSTVFHTEKWLRTISVEDRLPLNFLRGLIVSSSYVSENLKSRIIERLTPNLFVGYGTNECGTIAIARPEDHGKTPNSVGRPLPDVELQIVDSEDRPLTSGEAGHIKIRTSAMLKGYDKNPEETEKAFREGWFYPGDIISQGKYGDLIYLGRSDQMMIMNGINIYPSEIESVISSHPSVLDVTAFPMHHEVSFQVPLCAVTLRDNNNLTEAELLSFSQQRLGHKAPKRVIVLNQIPRNNRGKIIRDQLYTAVREELAKQRKSTQTHN